MKNPFFFSFILLFIAACNKQLDAPLELENTVTKEYLNDTDQRHYVIGLIPPEEVMQLKKQISDFNRGNVIT